MRPRHTHGLAALSRAILAILAILALGLAPQALARQPNTDLKPVIRGLISMGNVSFERTNTTTPDRAADLADLNRRPGAMQGLVLNVGWWEFEPAHGTFSFAAIDDAIANVAAYNTRFPRTPIQTRLRVWVGPQAPQWAKSLGGAPVTITRFGIPVTVARWWSPPVIAAWRAAQTALAARYDTNPLIADVTITSCSAQTDEPFVASGSSTAIANLHHAGYSDSAYKACLLGAPADYAAWTHTRLEFPLNIFHGIDTGSMRADPAFTMQVLSAFTTALGTQAEISNHALSQPPIARNIPIYAAATKRGAPNTWQTVAPAKTLNWPATVSAAVSFHANSLELWPKKTGWPQFPAATLAAWSAKLVANPPPSP